MAFNTIKKYPVTAFYEDSQGNKRDNFVQGFELGFSGEFLGLAFGLYGPATGTAITDRAPNLDAVNDITPHGLDTISYPYHYDPVGDQWDRQRGNHSGTLLASAARTATVQSADQINYNARGVHVIINVSAYPAAASVVPTIQGLDPLSGVYYDILIGSAITATGYTILKIYPGIGEVANGAASDILPRNWRINMEHADADSITYSVGYQLVL